MEVCVIGAGASGLMAAIQAARMGSKVTLLEGMEKPGKKLLVTGNGRCNLTNRTITDGRSYHTGNGRAANAILQAFSAQDAIAFFEELNLLLKTRDGELVYPYSDQAQSVLDALLWEMARLKVKLKCREKVCSIVRKNNRFLIKTEGWQYEADRVILAAGGKAAPVTGSDGSGYALARELGHTVLPVLPALVPLTVKEPFAKNLEGVRSRARLTLLVDGKREMSETGELQWTAYGISGIVVFQLSSTAVRAQKSGKNVRIVIDLFPDFSMEELREKVSSRMEAGSYTYEQLLGGFYHQKLFRVLMKKADIKPNTPVQKEKALSVLEMSKKLILTITGFRSFDQAQVSSGGLPLSEVDATTLESKLVKGLYLAGELLDVDGPCGGYNLQWAWSSGCVAGIHAGKGEL